MTARGPLVIVSGPSGSGKSTVIARLLATSKLPLHLSVSATTRPPRPGERDGVHYHFWDPELFAQEMRAGAFLEWACVHGQRYGTLRQEVEPFRDRGIGVLLDIDVQGAEQIRKQCPDTVSVFLRAPALDVYEQRLRRRGTESEAALRRRLETAAKELARAGEYDYQIINADVERAAAELEAVIECQFTGGQHAG